MSHTHLFNFVVFFYALVYIVRLTMHVLQRTMPISTPYVAEWRNGRKTGRQVEVPDSNIDFGDKRVVRQGYRVGDPPILIQSPESMKECSRSFVRETKKRIGLGNREISVPGFRIENVSLWNKGSNADFERLRALDIEKHGMKVQLGEKTIADLVMTKVPDPTDIEWLVEKARLAAAGFPDRLPFGRLQRTVDKRINVASAALTNQDRLAALTQMIRDNRTQADADVHAIQNQLMALLGDVKFLTDMTNKTLAEILNIIRLSNMPTDYIAAGIPYRFLNLEQFREDLGKNMMFFLAKAPNTGDLRNPITLYKDDEKDSDNINIRQALTNVGPTVRNKYNRYFDMANGVMLEFKRVYYYVSVGGLDSGYIDGVEWDKHPYFGTGEFLADDLEHNPPPKYPYYP